MVKSEILKKINERYSKARGMFNRGILKYAIDLLECVPANVTPTKEMLLNGAESWEQYSYGGCALCYDGDICERLCPPSECKKKDFGRLQPNRDETWLDLQARALKRASAIILMYARY